MPDFPKAGILFYDVTTLLRDPQGFKLAIDSMARRSKGRGIDRRRRHREPRLHPRRRGRRSDRRRVRAGPEARQAAVADHQGDLRARVRHRLPRDARRRDRAGPAGADRRRPAGDRRHGARRQRAWSSELGGNVHGLAFLIELVALKGRDKLEGHNLHVVLQY